LSLIFDTDPKDNRVFASWYSRKLMIKPEKGSYKNKNGVRMSSITIAKGKMIKL
jgi:hypothetical protein